MKTANLSGNAGKPADMSGTVDGGKTAGLGGITAGLGGITAGLDGITARFGGGGITAGFGAADITPRGGAVSLFGQWETRITEDINDPMYANVMVIQSNGVRTIWVACDLCMISKSLANEVKRLLGISLPQFRDEQLILSSTHIHTGPNVDTEMFSTLLDGIKDPPGTIPTAECCRIVARGIEKAVLQAVSSAEPCSFEAAISYTITGVSRRVSYADGTGAMYGDILKPGFAGMEGRDGGPMQILYVRSESDGLLRGVVVTAPCTAQVDEMGNYVTADYWATAREVIKNGLGKDAVVLGLCRSAGDLSPHAIVDGGKLIDRLYGKNGAVVMGKRVGKAVVDAVDNIIASYGSDVVYKHVRKNVNLPLWTASKEEYEKSVEYMKSVSKGELGALKDMMAYSEALARIKRYESGLTVYPADFFSVRIGDIVFVTNPFEMYIEYADRIRAACPETQVFDVQLTGADCLGYLATQKAIDAGGYSTMIFSCHCNANGGGEMVVEKSISLIKSLFE